LIEKIEELLANEDNISFGYLFGSVLRDDFSKHSDVDIALYFKDYSIDSLLEITHKIDKMSIILPSAMIFWISWMI
jgi:predicted nucleotidyltransferase